MKLNKIVPAALTGILGVALVALFVMPGFSAEAQAGPASGDHNKAAMMEDCNMGSMQGDCNMAEMANMPEACMEMMGSHGSMMSGDMHSDMTMHKSMNGMENCPMMGHDDAEKEDSTKHNEHH